MSSTRYRLVCVDAERLAHRAQRRAERLARALKASSPLAVVRAGTAEGQDFGDKARAWLAGGGRTATEGNKS